MIVPAMLLTSLWLVVTVADTVPRYDVRSTCRKAVALTAMGEGGRTVESCVAGEEAARKRRGERTGQTHPPRRANSMRQHCQGRQLAELCRAAHLPRNDARLTQASGRRAGQLLSRRWSRAEA